MEGAREAALRLLERDPLREEAHAALIEVYGRTGSRSQVSRQYRRVRSILARELGVNPLPETESTYRRALTSTVRRSMIATLTRARPAP
jgi:DNA-binding SARP family transcriptional activator